MKANGCFVSTASGPLRHLIAKCLSCRRRFHATPATLPANCSHGPSSKPLPGPAQWSLTTDGSIRMSRGQSPKQTTQPATYGRPSGPKSRLILMWIRARLRQSPTQRYGSHAGAAVAPGGLRPRHYAAGHNPVYSGRAAAACPCCTGPHSQQWRARRQRWFAEVCLVSCLIFVVGIFASHTQLPMDPFPSSSPARFPVPVPVP